jgi:hypothetical protein
MSLAAFVRGGEKMENTSIRTMLLEFVDVNGASHICQMPIETTSS